MPRRPRLVLLLPALFLAACGGGDGAEEERADAREEAQAAVRAYLTAVVDKRGAAACERFTPEYQRELLRQHRAFAREHEVDDCAGLLDATLRATPKVNFEGKPLERETIDELELQATVRQSGEGHNATVTGRRGRQRYELETRDGRWLIAGIEQVGL